MGTPSATFGVCSCDNWFKLGMDYSCWYVNQFVLLAHISFFWFRCKSCLHFLITNSGCNYTLVLLQTGCETKTGKFQICCSFATNSIFTTKNFGSTSAK